MSKLFAQLKSREQKYDGDEALIQTELTVGRSVKKLRFLIVGAFILSLLALLGAGFLYQSLSSEKRQRAAYEAAQSELNASSTELNEQVAKYKTVISGLREQISEYSGERKQFKKELERNNIEIENLQKKVLALEDQKRRLSERTAQAVQATAAVVPTQTESVQQPIDEVAETNAQDAELKVDSNNASESQPVKDSNTQVNLTAENTEASAELLSSKAVSEQSATSEVTSEESEISSAGVTNQATGEYFPSASEAETSDEAEAQVAKTEKASPSILSVNRKYSFAVVNIGRKEGVKIGDNFHVFRNNTRVATLEVEKLYDHFVAAKILKEATPGEIAQGDEVRKIDS